MEIPTKLVEKAKFIQTIFTDVETEYDRLLHLITSTFDSVWRRCTLATYQFSTGSAKEASFPTKLGYFPIFFASKLHSGVSTYESVPS